MFDHWDHTLQTGNDGEYMAVVVALCVGAMYPVARSVIRIAVAEPDRRRKPGASGSISAHARVLTQTHDPFPGFLIPASPPVPELRV